MKETIIRALLFAIFLLIFLFVVKIGIYDAVLCAFVSTYILEGAVKSKLG